MLAAVSSIYAGIIDTKHFYQLSVISMSLKMLKQLTEFVNIDFKG